MACSGNSDLGSIMRLPSDIRGVGDLLSGHLTHPHCGQGDAGCGLGHLVSSPEAVERPGTMMACPRANGARGQSRACKGFPDLAREATPCHFCHAVLVTRASSGLLWEETHVGEYRRQGSLGPSPSLPPAACTSCVNSGRFLHCTVPGCACLQNGGNAIPVLLYEMDRTALDGGIKGLCFLCPVFSWALSKLVFMSLKDISGRSSSVYNFSLISN